MTPRAPKPATKCHRHRCRRAFVDHAGGACPDGRGSFKHYGADASSAASRFNAAEIDALNVVLRGVTQATSRAQAGALVSLRRKAARMRKRVTSKVEVAAE